ncbi:uncharacterized protein LOC130636036 isoform X2 [Hydractinia symbiolongicarpus]|nr:uncharacterized protein LOC130636036 isoform X2 [Hydractinia symbiolongicarpus]
MEGKQATSAYTSAYDEQDLSILNLIAHKYYQQQAKQVPVFDYQYFAATNSLRHNVVLEQEKSFERVQKWLVHQHECSRQPPPDEDSWSSLRSSSAVETYSSPVYPEEWNSTDYFPRYRSEEHIQTFQDKSLDNFKFGRIDRKRYYSPNLMRRRYSPRLDQLVSKKSLYTTRDEEHIYTDDGGELMHDTPTPVNYYYYSADKGNTFPRRRKLKLQNRSPSKRLSSPLMGQQFDSPFLTQETTTSASDVVIKPRKVRPKSAVESHSYLLKSVNKKDASTAEENNGLVSSTILGKNRLSPENFTDTPLTVTKPLHKGELSGSLTKRPIQPFHVRMSSAPEPTRLSDDNATKKGAARRISPLIRKVKAFSWPKRALLPERDANNYSETDVLKGNSLNKTESGYNTEKSEEKLNNQALLEHDIDISEAKNNSVGHLDRSDCNNNESNCGDLYNAGSSDDPPERPPLPVQRTVQEVLSSCSKSAKTSDCASSSGNIHKYNKGRRNLSETDAYCHDVHRKRRCSHSSNCDCVLPHNDLSKTVSMSLKDLIRIHEQEIARVSAGASSSLKALDNIFENPRKTSLVELKNKQSMSLKRHTTIGLTNYSLDDFHDANLIESHGTSTQNLSSQNLSSSASFDNKSHEKISKINDEGKPVECALLSVPNTPHTPRRKNAPATLPKPKKASVDTVIVEPSYINVNNAREQFVYLTSGLASQKCDAAVQTDNTDPEENYEEDVLAAKIKEMKFEFEHERRKLLKKLEEQKKVANAYQKLEDRYRRKVCSLQKAMRTCSCTENKLKVIAQDVARRSISPSLLLENNQEISVQKVDGILHQLEAWLNHQSLDISEISSVICSTTTDEIHPRYKVTSDFFSTPPLEIIDKIDATSV